MNAAAPALSLGFAALNIDCTDPAALAEFWGQVLGRPVSPGAVAGTWRSTPPIRQKDPADLPPKIKTGRGKQL